MTIEMLVETETPDAGQHEVPNDAENSVATAIGEAEEIIDPLDGLIDRVARRSWRALRPGGARTALYDEKEDPAAFEVIRRS